MIRLERKKPSGFRPEYVFIRIPEVEADGFFQAGTQRTGKRSGARAG